MSGRRRGGGDPTVEGLDRDAGAAGEQVVEVQRALVAGGVDGLDLEVVVRARDGAPSSGRSASRSSTSVIGEP
jgi:hypothetical protein